MPNRFSRLRQEYRKKTLTEDSISKSPIDQFNLWFSEAENANIVHPNAMTLATTTANGSPDLRVVLLKEQRDEQFFFFTNYLSAKARQLLVNDSAALLFYWPELERQIRLKGVVEKCSTNDSDSYFETRPRGAQIAAIASPQSEVIESRSWLEKKEREIESSNGTGPIKRPDFWGGYVFTSHEFEFWQGRENRLHDRIRYRKTEKNIWLMARLGP